MRGAGRPRSFLRRLIARLGLLVLGVVLGLVLAELGFRALGYRPGGMYRYDPVIGWVTRDNAQWRMRTPEYRNVYRTNAHGMRYPEFPLPKPPGEKRVLVLGDSFVLAREVGREESLAARLEEKLGARGAVRVLPAACVGWGTDQEYLYLRERGPALSPDLVVLVFFGGNDFEDVLRSVARYPGKVVYKPFFTLEEGRLVAHQLPVPPEEVHPVVGFLAEHCALAAFARQELVYRFPALLALKARLAGGPSPRPEASPAPEGPAPEAQDLVWALVQGTRSEAQAAGARFLLVLAPTLEEVTGRASGRALDRLEERAREAGVRVVSLRHAMQGEADLYYPRDRHWNAAGHARAAEVLLPVLDELLEGGPEGT